MEDRRRNTLGILLIGVLSAAGISSLRAECQPITLPDDEDRVEFEHPWTWPGALDWEEEYENLEGWQPDLKNPLEVTSLSPFTRDCFGLLGSGALEFSVELTAENPVTRALLDFQPPLIELKIYRFEQGPEGMLVGNVYREQFIDHPPDERKLKVMVHFDRIEQAKEEGIIGTYEIGDEGALWFGIQLRWTLRRLNRGPCAMKATVSGDVSGSKFGDVAFYNLFEEGVAGGLAAGTALDPSAQEVLRGLSDFANWASDFLEDDDDEEGEDAGEKEAGEGSESEPGYFWGDEWDASGTDTFGLTLVDVKFDAKDTLPDVDPAERSDPIGRMIAGDAAATAGFMGAMDILGSAFSLAATGVNMSGPTEPGLVREVELTTLTVAPGVMDANVGGVKFFWKTGEPGYARLKVEEAGKGYFLGSLEGEAYTEREYEPPGRRLKIKVEGEFLALQGAISCQ